MKDIFEILKELESVASPVKKSELISLENALDRVLCEDILVRRDLPAFDNSALDGFALAYEDKNTPLSIKGTIFAGDKGEYELGKNECFKIMTGAKIPKNADTILMFEEAEIKNDKLIATKAKKNNAVRLRAEELKKGDLLLQKGQRLNAVSLALLASQGISEVKVYAKVRVGVLSNGSELKEYWQKANDDEIYNVNALSIKLLLANNACEVSYIGLFKDNYEVLKGALAKGAENFDLIISSAGASVGEADFLARIAKELEFKEIFTGVKAKFAKPTKLFAKNQSFLLCLGGNPLAAFLSCSLFAKTLLATLCGTKPQFRLVSARNSQDLKLKSGRNNLILGKCINGLFYPFEKASSSALSPLLQNDLLYISQKDEEIIAKDQPLELIVLS